MGAQGVRGIVNADVVDVVAGVQGVPVVEAIVEADHPGVFAHGVAGHQADLAGGAVEREPTGRVGIHQRFEHGRGGDHFGAERGVGHIAEPGNSQVLPDGLVVHKEEGLVLLEQAVPRYLPTSFVRWI